MKSVNPKKAVVRIGWTNYLLPQELAYQLHAIMGEAVKIDDAHVAGRTYYFLRTVSEHCEVKYPMALLDFTGMPDKEIEQYWEHQKHRYSLMGETFVLQCVDSWKRGGEE